jgi:DNA-binding NarL/FixJ family response regulator
MHILQRHVEANSVMVRTLVVTVSPLLAELLTSVLQPYLPLHVIGVLQTRDHLAEHLCKASPDLVLLGLIGTETDACARPLLRTLPSAEILVIAPDGRHAWLHDMRPHRTALTDLSVPSLIRVLASRFDAPPSLG